MTRPQIARNGKTDQFSILLIRGDDTIRCMVTVASGFGADPYTDQEKEQAALSKAKALAKALDDAIKA